MSGFCQILTSPLSTSCRFAPPSSVISPMLSFTSGEGVYAITSFCPVGLATSRSEFRSGSPPCVAFGIGCPFSSITTVPGRIAWLPPVCGMGFLRTCPISSLALSVWMTTIRCFVCISSPPPSAFKLMLAVILLISTPHLVGPWSTLVVPVAGGDVDRLVPAGNFRTTVSCDTFLLFRGCHGWSFQPGRHIVYAVVPGCLLRVCVIFLCMATTSDAGSKGGFAHALSCAHECLNASHSLSKYRLQWVLFADAKRSSVKQSSFSSDASSLITFSFIFQSSVVLQPSGP